MDPWSWLDLFVVGMSVVSLVVSYDHTGFVRIMRAFRVLRLFSHLPALRKILSALALAIIPVLNVFMILLILACICESVLRSGPLQPCDDINIEPGAVVGVSFFSESTPLYFGSFEGAFLTLFYVAGGDPWPDALPKFNEDGSPNWSVALYIVGYTVIEIWVVLQVRPEVDSVKGLKTC